MVITRLKNYPNVCRLCLKLPDPSTEMVPVSTREDLFHGTINDYICSITFEASEKSRLFPQQLCHSCLEMLRWHAKFHNQVTNISLLMNALADLKLSSNCTPLEDLFRTKREHMQKLFEELQLNFDIDTCAADIISEFSGHPDASRTSVYTIDTTNIIYEEAFVVLEFIDLAAYQDQLSSNVMKNVEENQPALPAPGNDIQDNLEDCPINESEIALGKEIELADDSVRDDEEAADLPKKRKYGRPRKQIKNLRCRNCTEVFHDKKQYDHHRWTAHKLFVCEECGQKFATQTGLDTHQARHRNEEEYQCEFCQRCYNVKDDLNQHIKTRHAAVEKLRCETCGLEFKKRIVLNAHILTHKEDSEFPCPECDKKFKNKRLVHAHKYRVHKEPSYRCDQCDKVLRSRFLLLDHIELTHGIQMRFTCNICVEVFDDKDKLKEHKSRHRSPSELQCATCLMVFSSKDQMFNHLCITYRKDYVCCNKDYGHHKTYIKHQLVKHGVKVNVRVKPKGRELAAWKRLKRKRVETCKKCDGVFGSRWSKERHKCDADTTKDS